MWAGLKGPKPKRLRNKESEYTWENVLCVKRKKHFHNMLIITQTFLKKNNQFLLHVFKGELSHWQRGVVPGEGKLEAQAWRRWSPFPPAATSWGFKVASHTRPRQKWFP